MKKYDYLKRLKKKLFLNQKMKRIVKTLMKN